MRSQFSDCCITYDIAAVAYDRSPLACESTRRAAASLSSTSRCPFLLAGALPSGPLSGRPLSPAKANCTGCTPWCQAVALPKLFERRFCAFDCECMRRTQWFVVAATAAVALVEPVPVVTTQTQIWLFRCRCKSATCFACIVRACVYNVLVSLYAYIRVAIRRMTGRKQPDQ